MSIAARKLSSENAPQIYVACLAAYNNAKLHGRWIDCTLGLDHVWDEIKDILKTSPENSTAYPCEEYAIHDYMNFPEGIIKEYTSPSTVVEYAELMTNDDAGLAIVELKSHLGLDSLESAKQYHDDNYCGEWDDFEAYSDEYIDSTGMLYEVPETIKNYFDYKSFARDLEMDYITIEVGGMTHVWHNS